MKNKALLIVASLLVVSSVALIFTWPSIYLHLTDIHFVRDGTEDYHPALSSRSLCTYLTVRDESDRQDPDTPFLSKFAWSEGFFHYEEISDGGLYHETALLALTYGSNEYFKAFEEISSRPGFSPKISFSYNGYEFRLNDTERLIQEAKGAHVMTDYGLVGEVPYLHWINLVGWSDAREELVFIGFFHAQERRVSLWGFETTYYPFEGWENLLKKEFSFYSWEK